MPVTLNGTVHREVGHELEKVRSRHRRPGEVPYPLEYTSEILTFDIVDHYVVTELCGGLTMYTFEKPPFRVLDLGCGGGMWIMSAAAVWTDTTFVGYDISDKQPSHRSMSRELADRIKWMHGNFLDDLPFREKEFDLVRIRNIGLGVPEDEVRSSPSSLQTRSNHDVSEVVATSRLVRVMEKASGCHHFRDARILANAHRVVRILKPGGVLEIIEEDLIFPCPEPPDLRTPRASPTPRTRDFQPMVQSRDTSFVDNGRFDVAEYSRGISHGKSHSIDTISGRRNDHRDHSKLKEAYTQMLSTRFINPGVLTILPFYLQAAFQEVQSFPPHKFYLPPPSGIMHQIEIADNSSHASSDSITTLVESESMTSTQRPSPTDSSSTRSSTTPSDIANSDYRARWHLARTLEVIRGCREAIWTEYEKIHRMDRPTPNVRLDRDDFEALYYNWECDMQDRIKMRDLLKSKLGWDVPASLPKPDWKIWQEKGEKDSGMDIAAYYSSARPDLCRSLRGFVCKKPIVSSHTL